MRSIRAGLVVLVLVIASQAAAAAPISVLDDVGSPYAQVYARLMAYFSPGGGSLFDVIDAGKKSGTIRISRTNIDQITWGDWAYCRVPSSYIFTSLTQATANVTIKLSNNGSRRTYITVTPDFVAVYGAGGAALTVHCVSTGALERQIIRAARHAS